MADRHPPALRAALWRWREVLVALALAALALLAALSTFGVTRWLALALLLAGLALAWTGARRLRFGTGGGAGIVRVDERRLAYWGPIEGGIVDMDDLLRLDLDPGDARPARWVLVARDGRTLRIPVDAEGAGALLDFFAALPGLGVEAMIAARARAGRGGAPVTLWRARDVPDLLPPDVRPLPPGLR